VIAVCLKEAEGARVDVLVFALCTAPIRQACNEIKWSSLGTGGTFCLNSNECLDVDDLLHCAGIMPMITCY
jgi:hypothetical protein